MRFRPFGQFWVMRDGSGGISGTPGNEESVTCRFLEVIDGAVEKRAKHSYLEVDRSCCWFFS